MFSQLVDKIATKLQQLDPCLPGQKLSNSAILADITGSGKSQMAASEIEILIYQQDGYELPENKGVVLRHWRSSD